MNRLDRIRDLYAKTRVDPLDDYEHITKEDHDFLEALLEAWPLFERLYSAANTYRWAQQGSKDRDEALGELYKSLIAFEREEKSEILQDR